MKMLVTGGCGFIGSNFIKLLLSEGHHVLNFDKKTYAAKGNNIEHIGISKNKNYFSFNEDICNRGMADIAILDFKPNIIYHFAAESHVDRSIKDASKFIKTNVNGTHNLLESAHRHGIEKFVYISTDEVYGSLTNKSPSSKETDVLNPRSPYSASKAAAEQIALSYFHTYNLPVIVTRSSNNYGPYQFPEKLLPLFITNLIDKKKVPLMHSAENPGLNVRDWLNVSDNCKAIYLISKKGNPGEAYNISGRNEKTNLEITKTLLDKFNLSEEFIEHIPHRSGHDFRYSINDNKLLKLGFKRDYQDFEKGLEQTIKWYHDNQSWWRPLKLDNGK